MEKLTKKQQEIYDYILAFTEEQGYSPSVREIGDYLGLRSPSTVHFHLKGLRAAGLVSKADGKTRTMTVQSKGLAPRGKIPLLGHVAAGAPILAQECIEEYVSYKPDGGGEDCFALRVRGESMQCAGILPDDLVIVRPGSAARNGEIVVALFEDEATVKTYRRETDGKIWLLPENPEFSPIDGDTAQIIGKVITVIRRY